MLPCLFNLYVEYIMQNAWLESRLQGETSVTSDTQMAPPSLITSQQIDGVTMKTVTDFIFLGSKITAAGDYSYEIRDVRSLEEKLGQT